MTVIVAPGVKGTAWSLSPGHGLIVLAVAEQLDDLEVRAQDFGNRGRIDRRRHPQDRREVERNAEEAVEETGAAGGVEHVEQVPGPVVADLVDPLEDEDGVRLPALDELPDDPPGAMPSAPRRRASRVRALGGLPVSRDSVSRSLRSASATAQASDVFPVPADPVSQRTGSGSRTAAGRTTSAVRGSRSTSLPEAEALDGEEVARLRADRQRVEDAGPSQRRARRGNA